MRLLVQPVDGVSPLVKAIGRAKQSVEVMIFRFDQREVEQALAQAVSRGLSVRALIAHTNRSGEASLRRLEMRLLAAGVTVARTADDLMRYHGKLMIIDRRELYVLAFNFTSLDMDRSRSFGLITRSRALVRESVKLFEADSSRRPFEAGTTRFLVSPVNARRELSKLIKGAKKELLIYDLKISDPAMIKLLSDRAKAGVQIKIIGRLTQKLEGAETRKLHGLRLHARAIVRDRHVAFIGSQSLRKLELDSRREVGVIFRDTQVVARLAQTFESDWSAVGEPKQAGVADQKEPAAQVAKRVAKAVAKDLPPLAPVLNGAVQEVMSDPKEGDLNLSEVEEVVRVAVKEAVREAVQNAVEDLVGPGPAAEKGKGTP